MYSLEHSGHERKVRLFAWPDYDRDGILDDDERRHMTVPNSLLVFFWDEFEQQWRALIDATMGTELAWQWRNNFVVGFEYYNCIRNPS